MSSKRTDCIASIDQGTSSSRVLIVSCADASILGTYQVEHAQHYPKPGWVEHDPVEIWKGVKSCMARAICTLENIDIKTIGITNQRETTVVWNKSTGLPYHNAIVWNDSRTSAICERMSVAGGNDRYRAQTGLPIASYFSASKIVYLLETIHGLREDAEAGAALFGTIDSWLIWNLTGGKVHATDCSNASRTLLMDLHTLDWNEDILRDFDIPRKMLPAIKSSSSFFGAVNGSVWLQTPTTSFEMQQLERYTGCSITGVLGDQQAALFGQTCFLAGDAKCTYGTGAFLLMNTGTTAVPSERGLLTTVAYRLSGQPVVYALEGSCAYSGSLIQWLRDNLQIIGDAKQSEILANEVDDNGDVYFVPAFSGLYAPHWRTDARGVICGLTAFATRQHIARAALEAAAFQVHDVVDAMVADMKTRTSHASVNSTSTILQSLRVDGGMTTNDLLMQFQSDILSVPLSVPAMSETTALGAAFIAGLGAGVWTNVVHGSDLSASDLNGAVLQHLCSMRKSGKHWTPRMKADQQKHMLGQWKKAVQRSLNWKQSSEPVVAEDKFVNCSVVGLATEERSDDNSEFSQSMRGKVAEWQNLQKEKQEQQQRFTHMRDWSAVATVAAFGAVVGAVITKIVAQQH